MSVPGHRLDRMFNPKTVVVIGDKGPGYMWIKNNMPFKEKGGNLYSVQIDEKEIPGIEALGITNFRALSDVPEPVDYAMVAVPRQVSPYVLKDLIAAKAGGAGFFTSGFAETGEELGVKLQDTLTTMAREANFNVVGPNCMGLYLPKVGVRFNADAPVADDGRVAFMAQSGTHGIMFSLVAAANGIHLSRCATIGNSIALDASDYLEYFAADPETEIIGMYLEGVKDGRRFFRTLREAAAKKPVVVWKGGQTDAGARATMSHTASLAAPHAIWEGMMRQCGAISTNNLDETIDAVSLLLNTHLPKGDGMALLAMTGGQSVSISDAFARAGLRVPRFSGESYEALSQFFNIVGGSYQNPLDAAHTVFAANDHLERILRIVEADPNVDAVAMEMTMMVGGRRWREDPKSLDTLLATLRAQMDRSKKPFMLIVQPANEEALAAQVKPKFVEQRIPLYPSMERAALAMSRVLQYATNRP